MKTYFTLLLIFLFTFFSCKKHDSQPEKEPTVYIVGIIEGNNTLWVNNIPESIDIDPSSVYVNGEDVYIAGIKTGKPCYTKNGVITYLADNNGSANSIFVNNNNIYVGGRKNLIATIWNNDVATELTSNSSVVYDIFVKDNTVYAVGNEKIDGITKARAWQNGVPETLSDINFSFARSVFVDDDNNVYYIWKGEGVSHLVKNGTEIFTESNADFRSVFVENGDVYVAGTYNNGSEYVASYWKNNIRIDLTDGTAPSYVDGFFVKNGDVYVIGSKELDNGNQDFILWKNGTTTVISPNVTLSSYLESIFVK